MRKHLAASMLCVTPLLAGLASAATPADTDYVAATEKWQAERLEKLKRPNGWLTLVGLHWIEPGTHRAGSAKDNDIALATGPAHVGTIVRDEASVRLIPASGSGIEIDGKAVTGETILQPASEKGPATWVAFPAGGGFQLHPHGQRIALRVKNPQAKTRTEFAGLEYFSIDPAWRVEAKFEPHPAGATIDIASIAGALEPTANPGALVFERDGKSWRLEALEGDAGGFFIIFADRTSGRETYGAGRFIDTDAPKNGVVVLDFNRAYNPPCAFNEYSTCPLPPPENRLKMAVTAGEKKYQGKGGH